MLRFERRWLIVSIVVAGTAALLAGTIVVLSRHRSVASLTAPGTAAGPASPAPSAADPSAAGLSGTPAASPRASLSPTPSGVFFENTGDVKGWDNYPQNPQKDGVIKTVTSPTFKGDTAIEATQTYLDQGGGYHSETVRTDAERIGEDRYFGQAIYLPPTWVFHNQNVTFQQFSPEDPAGPWLLMFVLNDEIAFGGSGGIAGTVGKITSLRGTWIRLVVHLKLAATGGAVEAWFNGVKTVSMTNRAVLPKTANSIRWSSGIYCTGWRSNLPTGPRTLSIFHDQFRIASSYDLAEPANW